MKVFAISDLHLSAANDKPMDIFGDGWLDYFEHIKKDWSVKVSDDDLVLLPGDLSWAMTLPDAMQDIMQLAGLKGKKVLIRGNHDYWWKSISKLRSELPDNIYAVQNDCLRFGDYLICGSRGWVCPDESGELSEEDNKIYTREGERLKLSLSTMERMRKSGDKVICMMHYPPFNVKRTPSVFTGHISDYKVDCVVYGHLHGSNCRADNVVNLNGIRYYLTSCDLVKNKLVQIF